jgi:hypothetical protein
LHSFLRNTCIDNSLALCSILQELSIGGNITILIVWALFWYLSSELCVCFNKRKDETTKYYLLLIVRCADFDVSVLAKFFCLRIICNPILMTYKFLHYDPLWPCGMACGIFIWYVHNDSCYKTPNN